MTAHVFVDETKRAGYVLAAVSVAEPGAARKVLRGLVLPGQRRIHMKHERTSRRGTIVAAVVAIPDVQVRIYDAARRYPTDNAARAACLAALVEDLGEAERTDTRLVLEQDDSLISFDNQRLVEGVRATGQQDTLHYEHARAHAEPLLALPDITAWCWARSGEWRRRITPIIAATRTI